jgi:hypothetical protein
MKRFKSVLSASCMALILVAVCSAVASASPTKIDATFGTAVLPSANGTPRQAISTCLVRPNGKIAIAGSLGEASPDAGVNKRKQSRIATAIADKNGNLTRRWLVAPKAKDDMVVASAFSSSNQFAYLTHPVSEKFSNTFLLRRVGADGNTDFFKTAKLKLPALSKRGSWRGANVIFLKDGGLLAAINRPDGLYVFRFKKDGSAASFGTDGRVKTSFTKLENWFIPATFTTPLHEAYDGSIYVGASGRPGEAAASKSLGLLKLDANGAPVTSFGERGLWIPPASVPNQPPWTASGQASTVAPSQLMSVDGAQSERDRLTVLFATGSTLPSTGTKMYISIGQFASNGSIQIGQRNVGSLTNAGDGGFPLTTPWAFGQGNSGGYLYANGIGETDGAKANSLAEFANWRSPAQLKAVKQTNHDQTKFLPVTYTVRAGTPYVYECGAVSTGGTTASGSWKSFHPAIRRFKLAG